VTEPPPPAPVVLPRRAYPDRPVPGVGAVVVCAGGVVLVQRRFPPLAGHWSLPGGGVEIGETLAQAVVREVREETGLDVVVGPVIDVIDRIHLDDRGRVAFHYVIVDYACRAVGGTLCAGSDASSIVVASAAEMASFAVPQETRRVIDQGVALVSRMP
jgi:ADP-ribose pyrophosphatase YjhB (NUDIX family)